MKLGDLTQRKKGVSTANIRCALLGMQYVNKDCVNICIPASNQKIDLPHSSGIFTDSIFFFLPTAKS